MLDYGADMLVSNNPFEMGMDRLVDLDKPDFIGKAVLQRIKANGSTVRRMMGAFMDGPAFNKNNEHRWPVFKSSRQVGEVTSAVHSPRLEKNIGFVLADVEVANVGENSRSTRRQDGARWKSLPCRLSIPASKFQDAACGVKD